MMTKTLSILFLAVAALAMPCQSQLLNTGFETSDGGSGAQNWGNWFNGGAGVSQQRVTSVFHSGGASANTHFTSDIDNDLGAWLQDITGWNVGDTINASIWAKSNISGGAYGQLAIEAVGGGGIIWGPSLGGTADWTQLQQSLVVPAGTTQLKLLAVHANTANSTGDLWWDDASVTINAIPEPSTVALLGLGFVGILGAVCRRK